MTFYQRQTKILSLGLPIIAGMLSQSVLNLIDAALVGQLGETALAGVGVGSYANFVVVSLILGLSSGVQTLVSHHRGADRHDISASPVNWGLLFSLLFALPLSTFCISTSSIWMGYLSQINAVEEIATDYFDYRTAALLAIGLNLSFRGWWNGTQRPIVYFKVLIFTHLFNVVVSYCLIFGHLGLPRMGAAGAGLGSAIAIYSGALINAYLVYRDARQHSFLRRHLGSGIQGIRLLRLSIPHSLQQFSLAMAICVLFWIVGQLGTNEQAIAHVLINLSLFLILPAVGLGVASISLVSHAIGEQHYEKASTWGWDVIKTALAIMLLLSLPLWLFPETILSIFLHSDSIIQQSTPLLQLTALAICLDAAGIVLAQTLLGVGANSTVLMITTLGQWGFYLPLSWLVGPVLGQGLLGIWCVQLLFRTLSSLVFVRIWYQQQWRQIHF